MSGPCRRVIACLDVADGRVVKGVRFAALRRVGDPVECALRYQQEGADEIVLLDVAATPEQRGPQIRVIERTARALWVPLTVGGGVRTLADVERLLAAGADKVTINSAAVIRPRLLAEAAARFGSQCVVASIDARRRGERFVVCTHAGRGVTALEAVAWARRCVDCGAGEILLTSVEQDGMGTGYDLPLTAAVRAAVDVPLVASGGAGGVDHVVELFRRVDADAALLAGVLHRGEFTVADVKAALSAAGIPVRPLPTGEAVR